MTGKGDKSTEELKENLINQLKSAYRKFKTYTYYDNYGAINREKLANFESLNSISSSDEFFNDLASDLLDDNKRKKLFNRLNGEINVLCYPKSIKSNIPDEDKDALKYFGNIPEDSNKIEKLNYFIDINLKSHILGTLWILRSGWILDHRLHKHCHGNRISKEVLSKIEFCEKDNTKYSELTPFLFEPYFKRYQVWRDEGLNSVEKLLDKEENAIMLSLDFKEYYYSSTIDFDKLHDDIIDAKKKLLGDYIDSDGFEEKLDEDLTYFIKDIFDIYTDKFERPYYDGNLPMIPLGFLPSLIISNWNLQAFDQTILDFINPVYYGRYVDDILIVFKSHPESESFSEEDWEITAPEIIEKYFIDRYFTYIPHNGSKKEPQKKRNIFTKDEDNGYGVNNLCEKDSLYKKDSNNKTSNYRNLKIQRNKLKIFRFSYDNSRALIENFKTEIYKNSSEFRLMHEVEKLYADIGKNIFSIQYSDSINKISDIESINLNKFELSKTLSRLIRRSIYESDHVSNEHIHAIVHAFSGSKRIEFMILWEKLMEYLFIERRYDLLTEEIEKILIKISKLELECDEKSLYSYKRNSKLLLKKSLLKFLYFTFSRVISLRNDEDEYLTSIKNRLEKVLIKNDCKEYYDKDMPKKFVLGYLYKNSLMKDPLVLISGFPKAFLVDLEKNKKYNLIKPKFYNFNESENHITYQYYPRYTQFHEATLHIINTVLFNPKSDPCGPLNIKDYLNDAWSLYNNINGFKDDSQMIETQLDNNLFYKEKCEAKDCNCKFEDSKQCNSKIDIISDGGHRKKSKVTIGLINTFLEKEVFQDALKGNPNRTSSRLDKIARIVNEAIKNKVELLIMPEMYIPYEWIPGILDISRDHGIAMVFGIEPIIFEQCVGNYIGIALPSETNNDSRHKNCTLIMRLKNSYSPEELREYRKYGLKCINNTSSSYTLCIWNDIYFVPYYCYEIANIEDRSLFKSCCDMVIVSEFNKDTAYFTAIAESLSRDLFCYCIKVNSSEFGGTCIIQPSKSEKKYLVNLKGGNGDYLVTHQLDINKLRNHQILSYESENKDIELKPKPPKFDTHIVRARMKLPNRRKKDTSD